MRRLTFSLLFLLVLGTLAHAASVTLEWDAPTTGIPVGFIMYRRVNAGQFELLGTTTATVLIFTDTAPQIGTNTYRVTAYNAIGESLPSNEVTFRRKRGKGPRSSR